MTTSHDTPVRRWRLPAIAATCLTLCVLIGACSPPQVNLKRADLTKITTTGFRVVMNLSIFNPNTYSLPLRSVGWDLNLFNRPFTKGSANTNNQIAASATAPVQVPLGVRFSSVSLGVRDFMSGQNIPWGIGGKCDFNTPVGPVYVNFAKQGSWASPVKNGLGGIKIGARHEEIHADTLEEKSSTLRIEAPAIATSMSW